MKEWKFYLNKFSLFLKDLPILFFYKNAWFDGKMYVGLREAHVAVNSPVHARMYDIILIGVCILNAL